MATRLIKRGLIGIAVVVLIVEWSIHLTHPRGDFLLHWEFGRRLRAGESLYEGGMHGPYPPAWAVPHVPLSLMPVNLAKSSFLLVGAAALVTLLWLLNDLTRTQAPLQEGRHFWVVALSLIVASRFIIRDFDDGGQNLVLLALCWLGVWLFVRERPWWGGASLGLAVALKCTGGIFVGYFLLKRQWKMVASSLVWTALFSLSPVFWMGPAELGRHLESWTSFARQGLNLPDPSVGVLGPETLQNTSLRPSLARYLLRLSPGHPGRHYIDALPPGSPDRRPHPWSVDFLDLSRPAANGIIKGILLAGILVAAWLCRGRLDRGRTLTLLWEAAIMSVLMLLYSPITWGQHCVATLPAVYLLVRLLATGAIAVRKAGVFLAVFTFSSIGLNRAFIGKDLSLLLGSYHVLTFVLIGLIATLFLTRPRVKGLTTEAQRTQRKPQTEGGVKAEDRALVRPAHAFTLFSVFVFPLCSLYLCG
jgi:alpha-1,2-mannosyltransferase